MTSQEAYEIAFTADFIRDLTINHFVNLAWADLDALGKDRYGNGSAEPPAC